MTLSEFAALSTVISGLAVTASVIYLALQTRQSAKHTRALISQGRIRLICDQSMAAATNSELATAIICSLGGNPTPEEVTKLQFQHFCNARFYSSQDSFSQDQQHLLDTDISLQMRKAIAGAVSQPAMRAHWENTIRIPGTRFAKFVDGIIATLPK